MYLAQPALLCIAATHPMHSEVPKLHFEIGIFTICDMIKRNELDVGHFVFEILAKTLFYIVFSIDKFLITL